MVACLHGNTHACQYIYNNTQACIALLVPVFRFVFALLLFRSTELSVIVTPPNHGCPINACVQVCICLYSCMEEAIQREVAITVCNCHTMDVRAKGGIYSMGPICAALYIPHFIIFLTVKHIWLALEEVRSTKE